MSALSSTALSDPSTPYDSWASAPGRVEFIGNHTDYNGGWVLGATVDRRVDVGVARRDDRAITLHSDNEGASVHGRVDEIEAQTGERAWANYVLGVLVGLRHEGLSIDTGFDLQVRSTLPVGAGLSSSAALELATAFALTEAYGGAVDRQQLVEVSRRAENEFVGVPCGILDQAVVAYGDETSLIRVDARTETVSSVPFPPQTRLWIFRTHRDHALADAHYQERHDEARAARARLRDLIDGVDRLVDVSPEQLDALRSSLPDTLYRRARHASTEHRRVQAAVRRLKQKDYDAVGELLFASHESSRTDYENSTEELDVVVYQLSDIDTVLGARLTGAGFGGAVMAWTRPGFGETEARAVAQAYADTFEADLEVLACRPAPGVFVRSA